MFLLFITRTVTLIHQETQEADLYLNFTRFFVDFLWQIPSTKKFLFKINLT